MLCKLIKFLSLCASREVVKEKFSGDLSLQAATVAVLSATYIAREPNDDGPRVAVISPLLGGAFFYDRDEAGRRVHRYFGGLSEQQGEQVVRLMTAQVRLKLTPGSTQGTGWVNRWNS